MTEKQLRTRIGELEEQLAELQQKENDLIKLNLQATERLKRLDDIEQGRILMLPGSLSIGQYNFIRQYLVDQRKEIITKSQLSIPDEIKEG